MSHRITRHELELAAAAITEGSKDTSLVIRRFNAIKDSIRAWAVLADIEDSFYAIESALDSEDLDGVFSALHDLNLALAKKEDELAKVTSVLKKVQNDVKRLQNDVENLQ